jgi:hypothetical protein
MLGYLELILVIAEELVDCLGHEVLVRVVAGLIKAEPRDMAQLIIGQITNHWKWILVIVENGLRPKKALELADDHVLWGADFEITSELICALLGGEADARRLEGHVLRLDGRSDLNSRPHEASPSVSVRLVTVGILFAHNTRGSFLHEPDQRWLVSLTPTTI